VIFLFIINLSAGVKYAGGVDFVDKNLHNWPSFAPYPLYGANYDKMHNFILFFYNKIIFVILL